MKKRRRGVAAGVLGVGLFLWVSDAGALRWIVPAGSHAPGSNGTIWRTDLQIDNPGAGPVEVTLTLLPANQDNSSLAAKVTLQISEGGQASLADVIDSSFHFSGSAAILVDSASNLVVESRTYNQSGSKTFGQAIPGVPVEQSLVPGERGHIAYISKSDGFRTNLGFAGTSAASAKVTVQLFDGAGAALGAGTFDLLPFGQKQINDIFGALGASPAAVARAEVTTTAPVVAYASIVDNQTGDPIAVIAKHASDAWTDLLVPAISHADGSNDSHWRSDARLFNVSKGAANVTLSYSPIGAANPAPLVRNVTIPSQQILSLDDIALATFGEASGTGGLQVSSDQPLIVTSRTYNQTSAGTYGQDIPGVPLARTWSKGDTAVFPGLTDNGFRANFGYFNESSEPVDLVLTLKSATGVNLASRNYRAEAGMMSQLNNVFSWFGVSGIASGSLWVASAASTGAGDSNRGYRTSEAFYLSAVDNESGDPTYLDAWIVRNVSVAAETCVSLPFIPSGLVATYSIVAGGTGGGSASTLLTTFLSSTAAATHSKSNLTASAAGYSVVIDSDTTTQYEILDLPPGFVAVSRIDTAATTTVAGQTVSGTTATTFSPAWVYGPGALWCEGEQWVVPLTSETTTSSLFPPVTTPTPTGNGKTIAVHESLTVPAGTFDTVHTTTEFFSDSQAQTPPHPSTEAWFDTSRSVLVRQISRDSAGNVLSTATLQNLQ